MTRIRLRCDPSNLTKETTMTTSTIALAELAEKGADVDMLRQMVQFMAQRLMEIDVEGRCGAGYAVPHKGLNRPLALVVGVDLNQRFRPIAAIFILALDLVLEVGCCDLDEAA
jgi:hypothetical protein